jgi:hypothetical protein
MTAEELKTLESLTSEIKELRKVLTVFASVQYTEAKCMAEAGKHMGTSVYVRGRMLDGLALIYELKKKLQ